MLLVTAYFQQHHHWQAGFPPSARILVDQDGRRFMDEDASYAVAAGIVDDHGGTAWMIFDEAARLRLPAGYADWGPDQLLAEVAAGRTHRADSLDQLATTIGVPPATLVETVERWNRQLPRGEDPEFLRHETLAAKGAPAPPAIVTPPYFAVRALPAELAVSHAGIEIDADAAVRDGRGRRVPGLYAAGEAAEGILGARYVGGGTAIANAIVNGRSAGWHAAGTLTATS